MQQDRRQEEDRRVEVEDCRRDRDEAEGGEEECGRRQRQVAHRRARSCEEPVALGDRTDQQQPRDQRECGPDLSGSPAQAGQLVSACWQKVSPAAFADSCTLS